MSKKGFRKTKRQRKKRKGGSRQITFQSNRETLRNRRISERPNRAPHTSFNIARASAQPLVLHRRQHSTASLERQDADNRRRQRETARVRRAQRYPDPLTGRTGVHEDLVHPSAFEGRIYPGPHYADGYVSQRLPEGSWEDLRSWLANVADPPVMRPSYPAQDLVVRTTRRPTKSAAPRFPYGEGGE